MTGRETIINTTATFNESPVTSQDLSTTNVYELTKVTRKLGFISSIVIFPSCLLLIFREEDTFSAS